jgi:predicted Zn-ribbon and HTH transcriptional regulator
MIPNWIKFVPAINLYVTKLQPCKCERCDYIWFPRINSIGDMNINTCPKCKSKLWNIPKC